MSLLELSTVYRANAADLRTRIRAVEAECKEGEVPGETAWRLKTLRTMWREARDLAVLCERYYERGYRRNGKYTL